jgi:hypothetical protein
MNLSSTTIVYSLIIIKTCYKLLNFVSDYFEKINKIEASQDSRLATRVDLSLARPFHWSISNYVMRQGLPQSALCAMTAFEEV